MSFFNSSQSAGHNSRENRFLSFSDRLAAFQPSYSTHMIPSQESIHDEDDISTFENYIPEETTRPTKQQHNRKPHHEFETASNSSQDTIHPRTRISTILWPILAIVVPISILCSSLLGTVYGYRVKSSPNLFASSDSLNEVDQSSFVLVNFSATRLVFIASFLSSLAPILAAFIMTLWTLPIAQSMRIASTTAQYSRLPTPYQLSLIIGISLASYGRLWRYFRYLLSRNRSTIPRMLHGAAGILSCAILLSLAVFATDTYLHYTTQTIAFEQISAIAQPVTSYGRGLSEYCLDFDRSQNGGFPCSFDPRGVDPNFTAQQNELFYLQHNTSANSEIRFVSSEDFSHGDLAILLPQSRSMASEVDFDASTVGVSSQCVPISRSCDMRYSAESDNGGYLTLFNCSENFWGVIGKPPNISQVSGQSGIITPDAFTSPLAYKPAANLQYAFFTDEGLENVYNSVGYDSATDQSTLASDSPKDTSLSNAELLNPIYFALAGRFSFSSESAGSTLNEDAGIFADVESRTYADFVLRCSLTTYEVNYSWVQDSVQNASFVRSSNGSLLEVWHGSQFYSSVNGGSFDLQDYLLQAALQNTSESFAKTWANLYSTKILSTIGAFSSDRKTVTEQIRTPVLVAKVQVAALAGLVACGLAYTVLGVALGISAYRASAIDVRDIAAQLSLPGLTATAFGGKQSSPTQGDGQGSSPIFSEILTRKETGRVVIDGSPASGYAFRLWV